MSPIRIALVFCCLFMLGYVSYLVRKKRLNLKYSLLWMALAVVVSICAVFPVLAYRGADLLGFSLPSNFLFCVAIFFLFAICLSLSVIASSQARKAHRAIQEIAYLDKRVRELEQQLDCSKATGNGAEEKCDGHAAKAGEHSAGCNSSAENGGAASATKQPENPES